VHYIRAGSGAPALVFVHGFACSNEDWSLQFNHFKNTTEVVACDLRGHGLTPGKPQDCSIEHYGGDVAALVANLNFSRLILIGHSMGCRVVLEANRLAPERVAGLVLIDGSRNATGDPDAAERAARAAVDKAGYPAFAESLFRQMFFKPSAAADAIVARALRSSASFGADLWPRVTRWDASTMDAALAAVEAPVLVIQSTTRGADMKRAPLKPGETSPYLDMLRERLPRAKIEIVPAAHFTQIEAPETVNRLIGAFVQKP